MRTFFVSFKYSIAALITVVLISLSTVVFGNSDEVVKNAEISSDCKVKAYTDPQKFAEAMANPTEFMQLVTLMSNPQTAQNMMDCGMDSTQWNDMIANMSNPAAYMAASGQFMNPQMYMNWMTAMMNPAFYQNSMNTYMNPQMYMNWMTAMMNPAFYQAPIAKVADPKWQQDTTAWMMNPANFQKMFEGVYNTAPVVADASVAK